MVARARRKDGIHAESFDQYRNNLRKEAIFEKYRLKGKWFYRSSLPENHDAFGRKKPYRKEQS